MNRRSSRGAFVSHSSNNSAQSQKRRLVVIGSSSILLAFIFMLGFFLVPQESVTAKPSPINPNDIANDVFGSVYLISPKKEVPEGTKLSRVDFEKVYWPREKVPAGALRDPQDVLNFYAKTKLLPKQPILRSSLSTSPPGIGLMRQIPPGYRAVSVQLGAEDSVDKWATPDTHVDVFLTYEDRDSREVISRIVVENGIVLSFDRSTRANTKRTQSNLNRHSKSTVTILVSIEDALELQTAKAMGSISLVLRNTDDPKTSGVTIHKSSEWDKTKTTSSSEYPESQGIIRVPGRDGKERTFTLPRGQNQWVYEDTNEGFGE